ncbi:conserved Plasmodium protein, unknown function [Plasmodium berghei]|uniref:Tetratricopeptide repeat protein, putative n=2 Tax=Plasmodium berghei TaxID=5821 RepID=A0A509AIS4_PLABA|nr:tetratricopeptide repeat protein, putative [Plasmodium berghei ANKA]CXI45901.1 conserved Plasmodium protein, unknown function [Plasmodium berghei]SCM22726.1 conserved Plasmodium protein, unknown function [Plasmodium berghei]SCN25634.1 conserved Plasmodium protein, unknown function [Plasmodium berghei]SCO60569.1 conserved Plasmodium protein, unknown function [Plasmodium berghei]SCO62316.1 conserved Plasmodium protein, unknown function [Plasmodium berghei]|eukprot:XP_034421733.1 tetratricopeptide repeat protein, putative [Plasmodium berghei ANKA]
MEEDFNIDENYIKQLSEKYKNVEHPLFMDELPTNIEENEDLLALYNLIITDENELSLAKNYKEVGNDYFKDGIKYFEDAIISYTKGIDVLENYLKKREADQLKNKKLMNKSTNYSQNGSSKPNDSTSYKKNHEIGDNKNANENPHDTSLNLNSPKEEDIICIKDINNLLSDLYCNRGITHYKKKKYIKCLDDCKKAFSFNNKKYKSLYYSILCSYYIGIYNDAYEYVKVFDKLLQDEDIKNTVNLKDYLNIKKEVTQKYEQFLERKKKNEQERKIMAKNEKNKITVIQDILKKRNIQLVENLYNDNNNIVPVFYLDENMYIHFTVFLIYIENNIIETILDFAENQCVMDYYSFIKKNKNTDILYCYIEFPDDKYYMINNDSYICDVINNIKLFSRIMAIHIIENEEANRFFKSNRNIVFLESP